MKVSFIFSEDPIFYVKSMTLILIKFENFQVFVNESVVFVVKMGAEFSVVIGFLLA